MTISSTDRDIDVEEVLRAVELKNETLTYDSNKQTPMEEQNVDAGTVVATDGNGFFSGPHGEWFQDENGIYYAKIVSSTPDSDGDYECRVLDENGEPMASTHIREGTFREPLTLPWKEVTPDRELEHKVEDDEETEDTRLDILDEEQENLHQMQEVQSRTVDEGLLKLDVTKVTSASNSQQWAILVEHPVVGELRFYVEKPVTGWTDNHEIVRLLESYDIYDGNPYKLQQKQVYVEFTGSDPEKSKHWGLLYKDDVQAEYGYNPTSDSDLDGQLKIDKETGEMSVADDNEDSDSLAIRLISKLPV